MKGLGQLAGLMKEARGMQEKIAAVQETLVHRTAEGSAGGGMVVATANGRQEILSVKIEPEVLTANDLDMLQDLVTAAVNQALKRSQELMHEELGKMTNKLGISLPGLG